MSLRLAASAEMLFRELPVVDRVRRLHGLGFEVEIWDWSTKDLPALAATGATFSSMTGYLAGDLTTPRGSRSCCARRNSRSPPPRRSTLRGSTCTARGSTPRGLPVRPGAAVSAEDRERARDTLARVAELGERNGRVFTLENLNTAVDHPGTPSPAPRTPSRSSAPSTARACV